MAGRGPRCGSARVTPLGEGHRATAYSGRRVRPRYLLTTPAVGWRSTAEAAPAVGRACGPEPKERPHWWRTRRGRSYTLHTAEALAEDQSRRSGGTSEDWGWRGGTGGGPGPMDIEVARRRCHEPTAMRPELGLGWPGSSLRWTGTTCRAASLDCPDGATREPQRGAGRGAVGSGRRRRITVDLADPEPEPRCTVGGWVTVRCQPTM